MKILFLHGWTSKPGGVKPTYLAEHGHEVINPALPDDDFAEAVRIAQAEFDRHQPDAIVGSSRGGAVAINVRAGSTPLVLLCPAWKKWGTAKTVKPGTVILHSRADDVIPFADSEELAKNSGAILIEVGTDHRLADPEPLELLGGPGAAGYDAESLRGMMAHFLTTLETSPYLERTLRCVELDRSSAQSDAVIPQVAPPVFCNPGRLAGKRCPVLQIRTACLALGTSTSVPTSLLGRPLRLG